MWVRAQWDSLQTPYPEHACLCVILPLVTTASYSHQFELASHNAQMENMPKIPRDNAWQPVLHFLLFFLAIQLPKTVWLDALLNFLVILWPIFASHPLIVQLTTLLISIQTFASSSVQPIKALSVIQSLVPAFKYVEKPIMQTIQLDYALPLAMLVLPFTKTHRPKLV